MACERYEAVLTDAALGTPLPPAAEAHLAACAACGARLERERRLAADIGGILRRGLGATPSPDLAARVRLRVAATPRPRPFWLPALLATSALAMLLLVLGRREPEPVRSPVARATPAPMTSPTPVPIAPPAPTRARPVLREPEVIVPAGQAEAILRYAARLHELPPPAEPEAVGPLAAPAAIEIEPIAIAPVSQDAVTPEGRSP